MRLGKNDAGIILRENGTIEVAIPKTKNGNDPVGDNVLMATAIVMMTKEKQFTNMLNKQYKKLLDMLEKTEIEEQGE